MQIDLLQKFPPSGGFENIMAMEVFSRDGIVELVSNPTAVNNVKVIIDIMTRHAYFSTLLVTDERSNFVW